tara:strand:+ start:53368 stop:53772 length:405 start_codon:yes stop_codon:yes gene_type:complete
MKFYISAKWQLKDQVSEMNQYLIQKGHSLTADWTKRAYARAYDGDNINQSSNFSEEEISAILNSDVFIHLSDLSGKGKYVDLGIALASNKLQGWPMIYVVGKNANESQFYLNKRVNRILTDNLIGSLDQILNKQ